MELKDKEIYRRFMPWIGECLTSDVNFAMTWLEDICGRAEFIDCGDFLLTITDYNGQRVFYPPILKDKKFFGAAVEAMLERARIEGVPLDIRGLGEEFVPMLPPDLVVINDRGDSEYIYFAQDLINLSGKKFHSKRNFVRRFRELFPNYEFRAYRDSDFDVVMQMCGQWTLEFEYQMVERALRNWRALDLKIMVLFIGADLVGFSINNMESDLVAHTFFEKADRNYIGAYQALNNFTARALFGNVKYVNRQSDLNVEGMRKAKLSYNPVFLVDRYRVLSNQF